MSEPCVIALHLRSSAQLFNSFDPSPFTERDLDRDAAEYIVSSARECHASQPLVLRLHLDEATGADLQTAVCNYFAYREELSARELREHLRIARIAMLIGLTTLVLGHIGSTWVASTWPGHLGEVAANALLIGAWVAMWRPLELYLYDWWPIRRRTRLYHRLATCQVETVIG